MEMGFRREICRQNDEVLPLRGTERCLGPFHCLLVCCTRVASLRRQSHGLTASLFCGPPKLKDANNGWPEELGLWYHLLFAPIWLVITCLYAFIKFLLHVIIMYKFTILNVQHFPGVILTACHCLATPQFEQIKLWEGTSPDSPFTPRPLTPMDNQCFGISLYP